MPFTTTDDISSQFQDLYSVFLRDATHAELEPKTEAFVLDVRDTLEVTRADVLDLLVFQPWQLGNLFNLQRYLHSFGVGLAVNLTSTHDYRVGVRLMDEPQELDAAQRAAQKKTVLA